MVINGKTRFNVLITKIFLIVLLVGGLYIMLKGMQNLLHTEEIVQRSVQIVETKEGNLTDEVRIKVENNFRSGHIRISAIMAGVGVLLVLGTSFIFSKALER